MKFSLTFKTPDVVDQLPEENKREAEKLVKKFVEWGEYITIEFDTEDGTATVREKP